MRENPTSISFELLGHTSFQLPTYPWAMQRKTPKQHFEDKHNNFECGGHDLVHECCSQSVIHHLCQE
jgi:hypothetical protein